MGAGGAGWGAEMYFFPSFCCTHRGGGCISQGGDSRALVQGGGWAEDGLRYHGEHVAHGSGRYVSTYSRWCEVFSIFTLYSWHNYARPTCSCQGAEALGG